MRLRNAAILAGAAALVLAFLAVGVARKGGGGERVGFRVRFDNAGGLEPGAFVLLAGMPVGEVTGIAVAEEAGRPVIEVSAAVGGSARTHLKIDTPAHIGSLGLVGEKHLALGFGSPGAPPLPEGGVLKGESPADLHATMKRLERTVANLEAVTQTMAEINENLKEATAKLKEQWTKLASAVSSGAESLKFWRWFGKEGGAE